MLFLTIINFLATHKTKWALAFYCFTKRQIFQDYVQKINNVKYFKIKHAHRPKFTLVFFLRLPVPDFFFAFPFLYFSDLLPLLPFAFHILSSCHKKYKEAVELITMHTYMSLAIKRLNAEHYLQLFQMWPYLSSIYQFYLFSSNNTKIINAFILFKKS